MAERLEEWDAIVVGGGPAGSTAGNLLAQLGHRVLVLEREAFPRHHIGESLLPALNYVYKRLGVGPRLRREGFFVKTGGSYVWGRTRRVWSIPFVPCPEALPYFRDLDRTAYHVERHRFDTVLLEECARRGAVVRQPAFVREVEFDGDAVARVVYREGDAERRARARVYLDASGQGSLLSTRLGWKLWDRDLRNMAVYTYFEGARSLPGERANHIFIVNVRDGWIWTIPLGGGRVSVGVVASVDLASSIGGDLEGFLMKRVRSAPEVARLLSGARRTDPMRILRDWSYTSRRFAGPNFMLMGDAAAFIDPLLSYGVTLAMHSAALAADCAHVALERPERAGEALEHYERAHQGRFGELLDFVKYFYDANRHRSSYFWKARRVADPGRNRYLKYAFAYLISGYKVWDEVPKMIKMYYHWFFDGLGVPAERLRRSPRFLREVGDLGEVRPPFIDQPFEPPSAARGLWDGRGAPLRYEKPLDPAGGVRSRASRGGRAP